MLKKVEIYDRIKTLAGMVFSLSKANGNPLILKTRHIVADNKVCTVLLNIRNISMEWEKKIKGLNEYCAFIHGCV